MRKFTILTFLVTFYHTSAQQVFEKQVSSEVNEVTVFIENAQITRKKEVSLNAGITLLKFTNLSPFIKSKSVQVKANGNVTVLAVNHQQNYIDKLEKSSEILKAEAALEEVQDQITLVKTRLGILAEEVLFLKENRSIGGNNQTLNVTDLKAASDFYSQKLTALKLKEIEYNNSLKKLTEKEKNILDQISTLSSIAEFTKGEIVVKIASKSTVKVSLELTYLVGNASWYPSYDIRAKDVNNPIELIYKANVKQDTKVDWKDVKLSFSSANPNRSGIAPELKTYYLDYNIAPPKYNGAIQEVSGFVFDNNNEPLPGANIIIKGTTIGTTTNFDGFYTISIPNNSSILEVSYIGFNSKSVPITKSVQNVHLTESSESLDEVVVTEYGSKVKTVADALQAKVAGVQIRGASSTTIPLEKIENQTTVNFEINLPYTVKSDNKSYAVDMVAYQLPASYQYYAIPKIEKEAFLIAKINSWEQYNLLEGEANIFFENTFIGKTILDVRHVVDTLEISLGSDKNVNISREKRVDYTSKKFVGTKKEVSQSWQITVKNSKSTTIKMLVLDQIPVSRQDEIKVEIGELSKAHFNSDTGELKWEFDLNAHEKIEFNVHYTVKYPKNKTLLLE